MGTGSTDAEGELKPGDVQECSPVRGAFEDETVAIVDETATVGMDEAEMSDCACLARFLVAAFVYQPACLEKRSLLALSD